MLPCFQCTLLSSWLRTFKKILWLVLVYYGSLLLWLLLLVVWGQDRTSGWPTLRGVSGKIFVNLKGRLEVNIVCLTLLVVSVQPEGWLGVILDWEFLWQGKKVRKVFVFLAWIVIAIKYGIFTKISQVFHMSQKYTLPLLNNYRTYLILIPMRSKHVC